MNPNFKPGRLAVAMLAAGGLALTACNRSINDALLSATDPDIINPSNINSPDGAEGLRLGVVQRLTTMTGAAPANTEGVWFMSGMLADEWKSGDTFIQRDETDKRTIALDNSIVTAGYRYIHQTRITANQAIDALRKYPPTSTTTANAYIAQMQMIRGRSRTAARATSWKAIRKPWRRHSSARRRARTRRSARSAARRTR